MALVSRSRKVLSENTHGMPRSRVDAATEPSRLDGVSSYPRIRIGLEDSPRHIVERVILTELRAHISADLYDDIQGAEWRLARVHQDFGENPETGTRESPLLNNVLYLTTVNGGPLVVFTGLPDLARCDAEVAEENRYVTFPDHLWRAVL